MELTLPAARANAGCEGEQPTVSSAHARRDLRVAIELRPGPACRSGQHPVEPLPIEMPALPVRIADEVRLMERSVAPGRHDAGRWHMPGGQKLFPHAEANQQRPRRRGQGLADARPLVTRLFDDHDRTARARQRHRRRRAGRAAAENDDVAVTPQAGR
jgi:hypothetical protein